MKKILIAFIFFISITSCVSFDHDTYIKNRECLKKPVTIAVFPFSDSPRHPD